MRSNHDGTVEFNEFVELARRFPLSLFPLYKLQIELHASTLGEAEWLKIRSRVDLILESTADGLTGAGSPSAPTGTGGKPGK